MDLQINPELIKDLDPNEAALALENKKIDDFYKKHPDKSPTVGVGVPEKKFDPGYTELAAEIEKMQKKSLEKHHGSKKKIQRSIAGVALTTVAALAVLSPFIDKLAGHITREIDLNAAVSYMDDNFMPKIYERAGFIVVGTDNHGRYIYEYDGKALINAENILVTDFGFERDPARLLLQKSLHGAYSDSTLQQMGYQTGEDFDVNYGILKPNDTFENMNEVSVANRVKDIKTEVEYGKTFGDYTITNGPTYIVDEEGVSR